MGSCSDLPSHDRNFVAQIENKKEAELCQKLVDIETEITPSELDGRIQALKEVFHSKPKLNRLLKTWYPGAYLYVTNEEFPQVFVKDSPPRDKSHTSIGPFGSWKFAERILAFLKAQTHLCDLRTGRPRYPRRFPGKKPCRGVSLKRCDGACTGKIEGKEYKRRVNEGLKIPVSLMAAPASEGEALLKQIKKIPTGKFEGGWKEKRSLARLLQDHVAQRRLLETPLLIEEKVKGEEDWRVIHLIEHGLVRKSWSVDRETSQEAIEEEVVELIKAPAEAKGEGVGLERLVVLDYLSQPQKNYKILPMKLLARSK